MNSLPQKLGTLTQGNPDHLYGFSYIPGVYNAPPFLWDLNAQAHPKQSGPTRPCGTPLRHERNGFDSVTEKNNQVTIHE